MIIKIMLFLASMWTMLFNFVNLFTSCVVDRYHAKQCIITETETEINVTICMYKDFIMRICTLFFITLLLLVLLIGIYPSNTLLCRPLYVSKIILLKMDGIFESIMQALIMPIYLLPIQKCHLFSIIIFNNYY